MHGEHCVARARATVATVSFIEDHCAQKHEGKSTDANLSILVAPLIPKRQTDQDTPDRSSRHPMNRDRIQAYRLDRPRSQRPDPFERSQSPPETKLSTAVKLLNCRHPTPDSRPASNGVSAENRVLSAFSFTETDMQRVE